MAKPFQAHTSGSTLSISAGTGSTRIALTGGGSFRVFNAGTGPVFIRFGDSTVTAAVASGFPLAPGAVEVITPPISASNSTHVAAITSTGTGIVYFTAGEGISNVLHWGAGRRFVRWQPSIPIAQMLASNLINAMSPAPDATRQTLIRSTFDGLATILPKLDMFFITAAHDAQGARLNWLDPTGVGLIATNSPAFVIDRGYTGDGTASGLATTGRNITQLANFSQDSASMFAWSRTDGTGAGVDFGVTGASNVYVIIRNTANNISTRFNAASGSAATANPGAIGFFGVVRASAAGYDHYKNGAVLGSSIVAASQAPVAGPFAVCRGQATFSVRQMAAGGCGGALNATEWLALYNVVQAWMTAVGA